YLWFVKAYNSRDDKDPYKDPEDLLYVGLATSERARGQKSLAEDFSSVLNDVLPDALKVDKNFWPAKYYAGMLLLEKYNRGEGVDELDQALKLNPSAAEALVGKGVAEYQRFEFANAENFAKRAEAKNKRLPELLQLKADIALATGDTAAALAVLEE